MFPVAAWVQVSTRGFFHLCRIERLVRKFAQRAGDARLGGKPDRQVQVGPALFEHVSEECVDLSHF